MAAEATRVGDVAQWQNTVLCSPLPQEIHKNMKLMITKFRQRKILYCVIHKGLECWGENSATLLSNTAWVSKLTDVRLDAESRSSRHLFWHCQIMAKLSFGFHRQNWQRGFWNCAHLFPRHTSSLSQTEKNGRSITKRRKFGLLRWGTLCIVWRERQWLPKLLFPSLPHLLHRQQLQGSLVLQSILSHGTTSVWLHYSQTAVTVAKSYGSQPCEVRRRDHDP